MITQAELKEILHYCPESGVFTFRKSLRGGKAIAGEVAGKSKQGKRGKTYWYVCFRQQWFLAHRIAFLYITGCFPVGKVDHEDGNGLNNVRANLRIVTKAINSTNTHKKRNGSLRNKHVDWSKPRTWKRLGNNSCSRKSVTLVA